jgi:hypothetical protein
MAARYHGDMQASFHSVLQTGKSPEQVAQLFAAVGWSVRKCSWVDYQLACEWAEFVLSPGPPMLLHGPLDDPLIRTEAVLSPLRAGGVAFEAEFYDADNQLTQRFIGP